MSPNSSSPVPLLLGFVLCLVSAGLAQDPPPGRDVHTRVLAADAQLAHERAEVRLTCETPDGVRELSLEVYDRRQGPARHRLIRIQTPPELAGVEVLYRRGAPQSGTWLALPALERVERLGPAALSTLRLAGSDFSLADLAPVASDGVTYRVTGAAEIDGHLCDQVEATPKSGRAATARLYLERSRNLIRRVEVLDDEGAVRRTLTARGFSAERGFLRAGERIAETRDNLGRTRRSLWRVTRREVDPGLPANLFESARLRASGRR